MKKMKTFTYDKDVSQRMEYVVERVDNIVGKGEK